ncbi:hypothetical protein P153DRAFT_221857 [Dothidotthia symphoricarpi CBS 119687]|uniref:Uncharacterized protein n=1 Tax=Dothidotthia symphoricarpi CBS 119687 TaxID=1392245 RepID=A0A6A6AF67_9PLEO|nr:uncharacterized protein P153DRAFT_221857 [Dothidotthia symphoricarpi CBS 119687]KAF2130612.1 hypothetical protein P153DRAFT_221857 [Dothidotthia symphoricarpi CBS 119687]
MTSFVVCWTTISGGASTDLGALVGATATHAAAATGLLDFFDVAAGVRRSVCRSVCRSVFPPMGAPTVDPLDGTGSLGRTLAARETVDGTGCRSVCGSVLAPQILPLDPRDGTGSLGRTLAARETADGAGCRSVLSPMDAPTLDPRDETESLGRRVVDDTHEAVRAAEDEDEDEAIGFSSMNPIAREAAIAAWERLSMLMRFSWNIVLVWCGVVDWEGGG